MIMSEKEFQELIAKNPSLRIRNQGGKKEPQEETPKKPYVKYWNIKVYIYEDGFVSEMKDLETHGKIATVFDSRREYARYLQLVYMQEAGKIRNLDRQKTLLIQEPFVYDGQKIKAITYNADFFYEENGREVVEDVKALDAKTGKSRMTEVFKLKWKILKHNYPQYDFRIF